MATELNYRLAVESDSEAILEFLSIYFVKDEPCLRALQLELNETREILQTIISRCLKTPFSTVVTASDSEIVAVLLNSVWNKSDNLEDVDFENSESSEKLKIFCNLLNKAHSMFWPLNPTNIEAVLHREVSSVATHFQRKGIATRLLTENLNSEQLKTYQIGGIVSETTSHANQQLLAKHGFQKLAEFPYEECVDSKGNKVIKTDDGSTGVRLNFKPIP